MEFVNKVNKSYVKYVNYTSEVKFCQHTQGIDYLTKLT